MVASDPKLVFDKMAEPVPEIVRKIRFPMIFYNEKHVYWY
jgi:hypothetical protein